MLYKDELDQSDSFLLFQELELRHRRKLSVAGESNSVNRSIQDGQRQLQLMRKQNSQRREGNEAQAQREIEMEKGKAEHVSLREAIT